MTVSKEPPRNVDGWVRSERPRKVNRNNIFDYMDGAGELYLAYSFVGLEVWNYKRPGQPNILLEIYEMQNPADAFGVLSFDLQGEEVGIGQKSVYGAGLLRFWKGRQFVRILADPETPAAKVAVLKVGRSVAAQLPGKGTLPELVEKLPQKGLVPESTRYFHKKTCLDYFYYLADKNILNLDEKTNAVLADYTTASGQARLLVVEYGSEAASGKALKSFYATYLKVEPPKLDTIDSNQIEGEQWVCTQRSGKLLLIVLDGKSRQECEQVLHEALSSMMKGA